MHGLTHLANQATNQNLNLKFNKIMAFKLVEKTEPLPVRPMTMVLFAEPGLGKTSISFTAEGEILFTDFDKGIGRAVKKLRPLTIIPDKWADFSEFVFSKKEDGLEAVIKARNLKTMVLDTIGAALDDYLSPHLVSSDRKNGNGSGGLGLVGFGAMQSTFNNIKAKLTELGLDTLAICHARDEGDEVKRWTMNVKGGSKDIIQRSADMIGFMYIKGGKRMIDFQPREWHIGKDIADFGEIEVPDSNTPEYNTFIKDLFDRARKHMLMKSEAETKFFEAVAEYESVIGSLGTVTDFVDFQKSIDEITTDELLKKNVVKILRAASEQTPLAFNVANAKTAEDFEAVITEISEIANCEYKEAVKSILGKSLKTAKMKYDVATKKVIAA